MKDTWLKISLLLTAVVLCSSHLKGSSKMTQVAQSQGTQAGQQEFEFRPQVVQLQAELLNCQARGGGIRINLKGTDLMPNVSGDVKAKSSQGSTSIEAKFENLPARQRWRAIIGMTYVLWTMIAKDRPVRVWRMGGQGFPRGILNQRTACRFWRCSSPLEPYLTFRQPSNLVVLEQIVPNEVPQANTGIMAKADLLRDVHPRRWGTRMSRWWSVLDNR